MEDKFNQDNGERSYTEEELVDVVLGNFSADAKKPNKEEISAENPIEATLTNEGTLSLVLEDDEMASDESGKNLGGETEDLEMALDVTSDDDDNDVETMEESQAITDEIPDDEKDKSLEVKEEPEEIKAIELGDDTDHSARRDLAEVYSTRRSKHKKVIKLKSQVEVSDENVSDAPKNDEIIEQITDEIEDIVPADLLQKVAKDTSHAKRREIMRMIVGRVLSFIMLLMVSVGISFIAWSYVFNIDNTEFHKTVRVPVETVNELAGDGLKIYSVDQGYVEITLVGKRSEIYNIDSNNVKDYLSCYVDLSKVNTSGDSILNIESDIKDSDISMEIESILPATMTIFADKEETKTVMVKDMIKYQLNTPLYEEYSVNVVINTTEMKLTGPATVLSSIYAVAVVEDLGSISESRYINSVPFVFVDEEGNQVYNEYVHPEISAVNVRFEVSTVRLIPIVVACGKNASGLNAIVSDSIKLVGDPKVLDGLSGGIVVNTEDLFAGETIIAPATKITEFSKIPLPEGVTLSRDSGVIFNVRFEQIQEASVEE